MKNTRILLLSLLLVLPACSPSGPPTNTRNPDRIKIGSFLSLTGATSAYGISSHNGIKLATDQLNLGGGINGRQVELVVEDDRSNTQEVAAIVNKLITQDKVEAILAEPVSVRAMAAAPIAQQNQVVMISSASVKPELTMKGDYTFRACFISSTEVKRAGIKAILIGSDGWDSPDLLEGGIESFEGVYFANHFFAGSQDPLVAKFVADYRVRHGVDPDSAAATAYDAARLLFDAFKRAKSNDKAAVRNALAETKDFAGVTG